MAGAFKFVERVCSILGGVAQVVDALCPALQDSIQRPGCPILPDEFHSWHRGMRVERYEDPLMEIVNCFTSCISKIGQESVGLPGLLDGEAEVVEFQTESAQRGRACNRMPLESSGYATPTSSMACKIFSESSSC